MSPVVVTLLGAYGLPTAIGAAALSSGVRISCVRFDLDAPTSLAAPEPGSDGD